MKNPIKNGKDVFAVLSMATVMSISMSVKVNAASEIDAAAESAATAVVQSENTNTTSSFKEVKTSSDPSSEKKEEVSAIDSKEASLGDKSAVVESANSLEISGENVGGPVGSGDQSTENVNTETEQTSEEKPAGEKSNQEDPKATEAPATEATADTKPEISEEQPPAAQKAPEEATEPDYSAEEKNIKDYSDSERYKQTDLQPGDTNQTLDKNDEKVEKDGFKFELKNPSASSPSKTEYGYEIVIDKKTGQRTYTKIVVTDSGLIKVDPGNKPMMDKGDKSTDESPAVTYKPNEDTIIDGNRQQRNLNYEASEETLKHINNKDNDSTSFGFKDNYTQDNPRPQFFGGSFAITYKVNPWPNENDSLKLMEIKGEYNEKIYVQGQEINTGVKVENIDESAKERLVGQVYNPITGKVVPGASAYLDSDGNIIIQMPEGALKKDKNDKYVVNKESIFNTPDYKALQNLDVKFFARPRTSGEFTKIAETPDEYGETGTYVETGAGSATINHKGTNVEINKQGIDRYDHYNLVGKLRLNLDDTRYYDQTFDRKVEHKGDKITGIKPGAEKTMEINPKVNPNPADHEKTAEEMDQARKDGYAIGEIDPEFVKKAEAEGWKIEVEEGVISKFKVTAPKAAKAGDFIAIPITYTYTNGSTDDHWFHFVVQESDNNKPEYHAEVGYKGDTLTQNPEIPKDEAAQKKNQPKSYELVMPEDGSKYKDSAGNEWTDIKVDPDTGAVTAVVPEDADIKGGENLYVNVKVNYIDEKTGDAKEEIVKAQFIARPKYKKEVTKTFKSEIPFETKVIYDETLEIGKVVKTEGRVGETETTFKQVVINGEKGIIDADGKFVKDKEVVETKTTIEKVDAEIRIGTKPAVTTVTIPSDTDYETSDSLKKGDMQLKEKGEDGEVTVTTSRDPETGEITTTKVTTKEAKNKKILIGTKTENTIVHEEKIPFEYEVTFDPSLKPGEKVVDQEGIPGSKTTTYNIVNSQVIGEPTVEKTDPVNAKIRVGSKEYNGEASHTVTEETKYITIVRENPNLPVGETKEVQQGVRGSKTTKYTQKFENGVPGEVKEELVSETPAVDRIIEVGTKTVTEHISKEITEEIPYGVKIEYDDTMPAGKTSVKTKGEPGSKTTEYYRNLINGKFDGDLNTREVTDKYKAPVDEVIVVGTKVAKNNKDYNNDVDVEIEYVEDDSKYLGYVEKGELTKGHVETKIVNKFDPATGKIITTEEEVVTPAKQKIVVGTKKFTGEFTHTIEKTLPFDTEIQYDDTMEAGTQNVTQKGVNGNTEQTVSQKYENGVLADKEYSKEETTKEPVKEIVKIGTKPVEKIVEIPFNTEYIYDNTIDAGTVVEDKDHPGKAGSLTVKTYFDKESRKFVSVDDEASKVAPVNKIVRVGTKPNDKMCPVPEEPTGPSNPSNPGGNDNPSNPGGNETGTPGTTHDKPVTPGETPKKPGDPEKPVEPNKPAEPGKVTEEKITDGKTPEGKTPEGKTPDDKKFEGEKKISDSEKSEEVKKTEEAEKSQDKVNAPSQAKVQEDKVMSKAVSKAQVKNDDRAPKTADAGLVAETASAGLASGLLLLLGRFKKREKEEENKKNK